MADNTILILGVAGAGAAIYFATRKQHEAKVATVIAQSQGIAAKAPSLFEAAYGMVGDAAKKYLSEAKLLDAAMKLRGTAHYKAWNLAVKEGQPFYALSDPSGALQCFATATGAKAPVASCPGSATASLLEGYF